MIEYGTSAIANLEAKDAALFVQVVSGFVSEIKIKAENHIINAKSIMGVISLGGMQDKGITIIASGDDEKEAIEAVKSFFSNLRD